jgi:hypothetical protein
MPEVIKEYYDDGRLKFVKYMVGGLLHREDGPAEIFYYDKNFSEEEAVAYEIYYRSRRFSSFYYRENFLPEKIAYGPSGDILSIVYLSYESTELRSKMDLPTRYSYDPETKKVRTFTFTKRGNLHRDSGPAIINFYSSDIEKNFDLYYYKDGVVHNSYGPAKIFKYKNQDPIYEYFLNGRYLKSKEDLYREISAEDKIKYLYHTVDGFFSRDDLLEIVNLKGFNF